MHEKLEYVGQNLPKKVYEIRVDKVEGLMQTGEWKYVNENKANEKNNFYNSLIALKGIGDVTAKKIMKNYSDTNALFLACHKELYSLLDDNDVDLLIEKGMVKPLKEC